MASNIAVPREFIFSRLLHTVLCCSAINEAYAVKRSIILPLLMTLGSNGTA